MGDIDLKKVPIVEIAVGLNLIFDVIERVRSQTGFEITPDNIDRYIADRKARREELNARLGVTG